MEKKIQYDKLIVKSISETMSKKQDFPINIKKVVLTDGIITVSIKDEKADHPLKDWDLNTLTKEDKIKITLELPNSKQTKIEEFGD